MKVFSNFLMCTSILFGIIAQMLLLDISIKNLKGMQRTFFISGNLFVLVLNILLSLIISIDQHMKLYALIIHVPIFLIFWITSKVSAVKVASAVFTAVFMIYPANLVLTIASLTAKRFYPVWFIIVYISMCSAMLFIINCFFKENFHYLIRNFNNLSFIKLCILPLTYSIANYWLGMYNFAVSMSKQVLYVRILIFIISLTAYILILDVAKSAREKEALEGAKMALSLLLDNANKQLTTLKSKQDQAAVYRHDMRHHLALIGGYLAAGDTKKAEEYIKLAKEDIDAITPIHYCENNTVNLILSYFAEKAKNNNVAMSVDVQLPQPLSIPDTELCTLLSNALDNATAAAAKIEDKKNRYVRVSCHIHKGNLLILVENSYNGNVTIKKGLPQSSREGHGLGVKSMAMITEKHNGFWSFKAENRIFTLKIVLPLQI